jgi:ATP-binding cassette subfamily G (WHITE) protein 2 (SNQ2)
MSDLQLLPPLQDIVEETPSGAVSRSASHPTLLNIDTTTNSSRTQPEAELHHHHDHDQPHPGSPSRPRRNSSVSHVDINFFDPHGVGELRRTLSQKDEQGKLVRARIPQQEPLHDHEKGRLSVQSSDSTLNDPNEPFDFQKTLLRVVRKYAFILHFYDFLINALF